MATEAIAEPAGLLDGHGLDSEVEDDTDLLKLKPPRPPRPKKVKVKEEDSQEPVRPLTDPLYEEEIIEGFSFCSFNTYEDLEVRHQNIFVIVFRLRRNCEQPPCRLAVLIRFYLGSAKVLGFC